MMRNRRWVWAAVALAAVAGQATGQAFPTKPVRMVVAFPPGGATDIIARIMAPRLAEAFGQQVVVDNRPGAAGIVGTELAARAAPDGHTWLFGTLGNLAANPALYKKFPVDVAKDFAPISHVVDVWFMLMVHPSLPVKSLKDMIALAKARPGELNYSSSGAGGGPHLAAELLKAKAGLLITHVPYKGSGPSITDLMAGQVQMTIDSVVQSLPFVQAGKLRAVAVLGTKRTPLLPDLPTAGESLPGYSVTNWFAMVVPSATPAPVRSRIHAELVKVIKAADFREKLVAMGAEPVGNSPEEFAAFLASETTKWADVIRAAKIQAE